MKGLLLLLVLVVAATLVVEAAPRRDERPDRSGWTSHYRSGSLRSSRRNPNWYTRDEEDHITKPTFIPRSYPTAPAAAPTPDSFAASPVGGLPTGPGLELPVSYTLRSYALKTTC